MRESHKRRYTLDMAIFECVVIFFIFSVAQFVLWLVELAPLSRTTWTVGPPIFLLVGAGLVFWGLRLFLIQRQHRSQRRASLTLALTGALVGSMVGLVWGCGSICRTFSSVSVSQAVSNCYDDMADDCDDLLMDDFLPVLVIGPVAGLSDGGGCLIYAAAG